MISPRGLGSQPAARISCWRRTASASAEPRTPPARRPRMAPRGGLRGLGCEPTPQDGAPLRFRPASVDVRHDAIQRHGDPPLRPVVARPPCGRPSRGLLPLLLGLPPLEVRGRALDETLGPTRAQGHPCAPVTQVLGRTRRQCGDHRRIARTHGVGTVPHRRAPPVAVIWPQRDPPPATPEGAHGEVHPTPSGLRTADPGVEVSRAGSRATRGDVRTRERVCLPSHLGVENLLGHLASRREDRQ